MNGKLKFMDDAITMTGGGLRLLTARRPMVAVRGVHKFSVICTCCAVP